MRPEGRVAEQVRITKAALAEVGADPEAVFIDGDGVARWRGARVDTGTVWRAANLARLAFGQTPVCLVCFLDDRAGAWKHCHATRLGEADCRPSTKESQ